MYAQKLSSKLNKTIALIGISLLFSNSFAQTIKPDLYDLSKLKLNDVYAELSTLHDVKALEVGLKAGVNGGDQPTFVWFDNIDFSNGTIEVSVAGDKQADAPEWARGFVGIAFRINKDASKFESFYVRPANGQAKDLKRKNHATQYFAYPDYDFARLRKESPEKYESPADIDLGQWIKMKIVVDGINAQLYVDDMNEPVLTVSDLKNGEHSTGGIGLWVDTGTLAHFKDLRITKTD